MYCKQLGLDRPPFEETTNPDFYFETATHRGAASTVLEHLAEPGAVVLVRGQPGSGKTVLSRILIERLAPDDRVLCFAVPPSGLSDLLDQVATSYNLAVTAADDRAEYAERITAAVARRASASARHVVILDQAENLSHPNLLDLQTLQQAARQVTVPLSVVLLAQNAVEAKLRSSDLATLTPTMVRTPCLERLTDDESVAYIAHRLKAAGHSGKGLFSTSAVRRIASLTKGRPRRINAMCNQLLTTAAQHQAIQVDQHMVPPRRRASDIESTEATGPQLEESLSATPARVAEVQGQIENLEARARSVADQAAARIEALEALLRGDHGEPPVWAEQAHQLVRAHQEADLAVRRLAELNTRANGVLDMSGERIGLMLTSIEAAQNVRDQLDQRSEEIARLAADAQHSASTEHDRLKGVVAELAARREELTAMIASVQHDQQQAIAKTRQILAADLDKARQTLTAAADEIIQPILAQGRDSIRAAAESAVAAAVQQTRQTIGDLVEHARHEAQTLEDHVADSTKKLLEQLQNAESGTTERIDRQARQAENVATRVLKDSETKLAALRSQAENLESGVAQTVTTARGQLEKTSLKIAKGCENRLAELNERTEQLQTTAETVAADAHKALQECVRNALQSSETLVAETQQNLATTAAQAVQSVGLAATAATTESRKAVAALVGQVRKRFAQLDRRLAQTAEAAVTQAEQTLTGRTKEASEEIELAVTYAAERIATAEQTVIHRLEQTARAADVTATQGAERLTETEHRSVQSVETAAEKAAQWLKEQTDQAVTRHQETAERTVETAQNRLATAVTQLEAAAADNIEHAIARINEAGEATQTAISTLGQEAITDLRSAVSSGIGGLRDEAAKLTDVTTQAANRGRELRDAISQGHQHILTMQKEKAEAQTCTEQVNHLIRDIWSLTTTTDQRIQTLTELNEQTGRLLTGIEQNGRHARELSAQLAEQIGAADRSGASLQTQHQQTKAMCDVFAAKIAEARTVVEQLTHTGDDAKAVQTALSTSGAELQQLIKTGEAVAQTIRDNEHATQESAAAVGGLTESVAKLEERVATVQQLLAAPLKQIREACDQSKAHAEGLRALSAAEQRDAHAVAKATVEAAERIKVLEQLLAATDQTARIVKQWVGEAARAQERLADTLQQVPPISATHPSVAVPVTGPAPLPQPTNGPPAPKELNLPPATKPAIAPSASKTPPAATPAATRKPAPSAPGTASPRPPAKANRLTPADIQVLIEAAKAKAPATQNASA